MKFLRPLYSTAFFSTVFVFALSGCTPPPDQNRSSEKQAHAAKRPVPVVPQFEGFIIPGTAADAKAMGFTKCTADYYAATCRKEDATLLNLRFPAVIQIDLKDGKMPSDLRELKYDEIEFEAPAPSHSYPCDLDTDADPIACYKPDETVKFERELLANGWKTRERRSIRNFYHPRKNIEITVYEAAATGHPNGVSIRRITRSEAIDALAQIEEREDEIRTRKSGQDNFEKAMATP